MNPNHGGLMKSIYQQELVMLTHYLASVFGDYAIEILGYEQSEGGMSVRYISDGDEGTWVYPSDMNTFVHEQTVRLISGQYSGLDY